MLQEHVRGRCLCVGVGACVCVCVCDDAQMFQLKHKLRGSTSLRPAFHQQNHESIVLLTSLALTH